MFMRAPKHGTDQVVDLSGCYRYLVTSQERNQRSVGLQWPRFAEISSKIHRAMI